MRLLFFASFFGFTLFGQYENYTWPVGAKDLVTFDLSTKQPTSSQRIANADYTLEGIAVANDPLTGDLLFYHDGHQVFTKNSVVMAGGTDIGGKIQGSTGQGAAIYSIPDCTNKKFIVFSNDADHSVVPFKKGKLYFSIVDMTNGTGVVTQAKTLIRSDLDEGMTVINDFALGKAWLVVKLMEENKMVSIPLSANYADMLNLSNHVTSTFSTPAGSEVKSIYTLKYNPQRKLIAMSGFLPAATVSTLEFNPNSGSCINFSFVDQQALNNQGNSQQSAIADVCWSPDGSKLYAITQKHMSLYQYDYNNGRNRTLLISDPQSVDNGGMKVDPSGKIWVINNTLPVNPAAPTSSFYISRIHDPNAAGGACNLQMNDFFLFSNGYFYFPQHTEYDPTPSTASLTSTGAQVICEEDTLLVGAEQGVSWLWSTGETTQSIDLTEPGTYDCLVTFTNGCQAMSNSITLNVLPKPNVNAGNDQTISCGQKVDLVASTSNGNQMQWIGNSVAGATYSQVGQGEYYVQATSSNGCVNYDTAQVFETGGNLQVSLADEIICKGETITLTPTILGQIGSVSYEWSNGATSSTISVGPTTSIGYTIKVTDNTTLCTDSKSIQVIVESLEVSLNTSGVLEICPGDSVSLETNFDPSYSYQWNNSNFTSNTQIVKEEGIYFATVSTDVCSVNTDTLELKFKQAPVAAFFVNEYNQANLNQEITIQNQSEYDAGTSMIWNLGNGKTSTEVNPTTIFVNPGSYFVQLELIAQNGCRSKEGQVIDVFRGVEEVTYFVPTAFTPNGDGINDILKIVGVNIRSVEMFIHTRWGELLFYSPNQLVGWNGNDFDGNPMPTGMYVVNFIVKGDDEKVRKFGQPVFLQRQ